MLEIYLIRHAQSTGNVNHEIVTGQSNQLELTDLGKRQAAALGRRLKQSDLAFDRIIASRAVRATKTAQIALSKMEMDTTKLEIFDEITELSFGELEGKRTKDVFTKEMYQAFLADPYRFRMETTETAEEVEERMYQWFQKELVNPFIETEAPKRVFMVSHGTAIRCWLRRILDFNPHMIYKIQMQNTAINVLRYDLKRGWFLDKLNDGSHLKAHWK